VDYLKIDKTFTTAIGYSQDSQALIHTLVQLGQNLGLETLAEGVETTEQVDYLRTEHVDLAQGFLMAKPLDPGTFANTILHLAPQVAH
jgi:c-di-GMP phosphodiesterase